MKATYRDFLEENKVCSGLTNNQDAKEVFEKLSKDENIILMLELSEQNQPALSACVAEIEEWHDSKVTNAFSFKNTDPKGNFNKNAVGRMVKTILAPFGYVTNGRKAIAQKYESRYFSSATCYKKEKLARLMVKKVIVEVGE